MTTGKKATSSLQKSATTKANTVAHYTPMMDKRKLDATAEYSDKYTASGK